MLRAALCITANSDCQCPLCAKSRHTEATARPCEQGIRRRLRSSSAVQTSVEECPGQQSLQAPAAKMEVRPSPEGLQNQSRVPLADTALFVQTCSFRAVINFTGRALVIMF